VADSLHPLTDRERATLKAGFRDWDPTSTDSRITHLLYSTGMHPVCLGNPLEFYLVVQDGIFTWERAKTRMQISVPVDPDVEPWAEALLSELRIQPLHPVTVNERVHAFGQTIDLPGLTPRGLRHDFSYRALKARGLGEARELTGTTTEILANYARRELARDVARDPRGLF
jgi:hypothetical protein